MLTTKLLHPGILGALASNGHGARVLIADGNFPVSTCIPQTCPKIFLNLSPGLVNVIDVLQAVMPYIVIDSALGMAAPDGARQMIHQEFEALLGGNIAVHYETRFDFYDHVRSPDICVAIVTGEQRRFANLLLTIGCLRLEGTCG